MNKGIIVSDICKYTEKLKNNKLEKYLKKYGCAALELGIIKST